MIIDISFLTTEGVGGGEGGSTDCTGSFSTGTAAHFSQAKHDYWWWETG